MRLPLEGREILYIIGHAGFDSTCCGVSGCAYALVPGFILQWRGKQNTEGLFVSEVEPIRSESEQEHIRVLIMEQEIVHQFQFL